MILFPTLTCNELFVVYINIIKHDFVIKPFRTILLPKSCGTTPLIPSPSTTRGRLEHNLEVFAPPRKHP